MKEIFVHESEMPKGCTFCLLNRDYSWDMSSCCLRGMGIGDNKAIKHCPLRSLEQHDKVVRATAIRDCAEILNDAFGCACNLSPIDEQLIEYDADCCERNWVECKENGGSTAVCWEQWLKSRLQAELLQGEESKND